MALTWITPHQNLRSLGLLLMYTLVASISYWLAYELRFDFSVTEQYAGVRTATLWWVVLLKLMLLSAFGQLNCVLAYFRLPDALRLFTALFVVALILVSMWFVYGGSGVPPRSVILSDFQMSFLILATLRVFFRVRSSHSLADWLTSKDAVNVVIVGAGEVGAGLCAELLSKARLGMRAVAFVDDDAQKVGRYVHGIPVAAAVDELAQVAKRYAASKVVIAFPSASLRRTREVAELARLADLSVEIVPALSDLVSGRAEITQLRPVQLEDLLGREPVDLNSTEIESMLAGKRVLITGAGGSIGSELTAQVLAYAPAALLCLDQAEMAIFNLQQEVLQGRANAVSVETQVLDVGDRASMQALFASYQPEVVFHAAAHKHVNLMERQPAEALKNNFVATAQLAAIASAAQVERFILISTDKAINPTSVMGASKRLAEVAVQEQQAAAGNRTQFLAVRFGNVLGSSGSVIPIFRRQIAMGGPLTVTDPEVTRFFMTVQESVGLVLQSAAQGQGGEIFVLDMGESIKIVDVARQMIALSGLQEGRDIDIDFVGLRPGEKLYEEVQHLNEVLQPTHHPRIRRFVGSAPTGSSTQAILHELERLLAENDGQHIKTTIQKWVPEYQPSVASTLAESLS